MPLVADRVRESTTTTGTGTITLAGAPSSFRTFAAAFGTGVSVYYVIAGPSEWEVGIGTTGAGTLSRDAVLASSNNNALVDFSAGGKDVFCAYTATRAVTTSDAATLTNKIIYDYTNNVGANATHLRIKAGAALAKGDVIKASGFTPGEAAIEVVKTASATDVALGIVEQALNQGDFGTAIVIGELYNVNTNGFSAGATLYQNGAGGWTATKPASGLYQPLGWVVRANANNGVVAVNVVAPLYVETSTNTANTIVLRDGNGDFSARNVSVAALQATIGGASIQATNNITTSAGDFSLGTADRGILNSTGTRAIAIGSGTNPTITLAGGPLTGISTLTATTLAGTLSTAAQPNVTSVGTLSSLTVSGNTKIGGGAASNTSRLMVNTANGTAAGIQLFQDGQASWILENVASSATLRLSESGVERMSINSVGNVAFDTNTLYVDAANNRVGVGTASPSYKFDTVGGNDDGVVYRTSTRAIGIGQQANEPAIFWGSLTPLTFTSGGVERARIDASGNLGLGVTPSAASATTLQFPNGVTVSNAGTAASFAHNAVFNSGWKYVGTGAATLYQKYLGAHNWYTAPSGTAGNAISFTQAMTLDASGNLGVGTASPATKLHVDGADGVRARISATSGGTPGLSLSSAGVVNWTLKSGNGDSSLRIDQDGTDRIWVASGGNLGIGVAATPTHPLQIRRAGGAGSLGITIDNVGIIGRAAQYYAIGDATNDTTGHAFYTRNATATNNLALTIDQLANVTVQNGNLILASATPRLQANMSGAQSSRFALQNSTTDGNSRIFVYPNGTGNISAINFRNNSNPDAANYNSMDVGCLSTIDCRISSQAVGTNALLPLTFYMNSTEMMRLDPAGNLGLGVAPSAWGTTAKALQVDSRTAIWQQSNVSVFSNNVYAPTGGNTYIATAAATQYYQDAGAHVWRTAPSGTAGNAITFTQAMTLDASGNLAVGLTGTVGNARAAISGTVVSTTNTLSTFSGAYGGFDWSGRQLRLFSGTADATGSRIEFYTGVAGSINSRMNIDADGNVGIGVGSTTFRTEVYKLDGSGVRTDPINVMAITAESNSLPFNGYGPALVFKSSNYTTQAPSVVARIRTSLNDNSTSSYGASLCFDTAATRGGAVSQKMALDFQGNLGVGVTPYLWFANTAFVDVGTFTAYGQDSAGAATMTFNGYQKIVTGAWTYKTGNPAARYSCGYGGVASHAWFVAGSGSQDNNIIWGDPRMLLDASGNLGVGTTTLTYRFNAVTAAQGAAYLQGANGTFGSPNAIVRDSTHGVEICITGLSGGVGAIGTYTNHAQAFYTNTTEKARITSAGYFKASNNGIYVDAASSRHEINTNANDINLMVYCTASTSNNAMNVYSLLPSGVSSSALHFAGVISGSGLQFTVDADGDVRNTNSSYGALSDVKLKQDIVDAGSQWDDIKAVRVRKYRFKRTPDAPLQIGVIAQELEAVSPGLVDEVVDRDDDGNALETTTKAVKYSILYMKSVKALQEAMARIETLEQRVAALEA